MNFYIKNTVIILLLAMCCTMCTAKITKPKTVVQVLKKEEVNTKQVVVFITGSDKGNNRYYTNAKAHFKGQQLVLVDHLFSLQEIISWINAQQLQLPYSEIHIVSHSNAWRGMSLKTTPFGERITVDNLRTAQLANEIPIVQQGIDKRTKIIFHSCGLGKNKTLMNQLKSVFTTEEAPKIHASSFFNVFGGKYAAHYLAKPYYGYYPTAESPGPYDLSNEFKVAYPEVDMDWFAAIKSRTEHQMGKPYTYTFNIPVDWEFQFDKASDIPEFKNREALMDWLVSNEEMALALYQLRIPIEKYRWKSKVTGTTLTIKGKTTVLCVLQPILDSRDINEYQKITIEDKTLYQIL